jgi:hypothetical protein
MESFPNPAHWNLFPVNLRSHCAKVEAAAAPDFVPQPRGRSNLSELLTVRREVELNLTAAHRSNERTE